MSAGMTRAHLEAVRSARFVTAAALSALAENPQHLSTRERSAGIVALLAEVAAMIQAQIEGADDDAMEAPCIYCSDGKRTGLPGNACENCMNTGVDRAALKKGPQDAG